MAAWLAPDRHLRLLALPVAGAGAGALAGAGLLGLFHLLRAIVGRAGPATASDRPARVASVLLAAPIVVYDALAMFGGNRASRIPGHHAISAALAAVGLALVWLVAGRLWRVLQGEGGPRPRLLSAGFAVLTVVIYLLNRRVLPHLYSWFHASLSLALIVTAVLAARLTRARPARSPGAPVVASALAVAVAAALTGLMVVGGSHALMFAAHERSQLVGFAVRASPFRPERRPASAPEGPAADSAPLPEGPHLRDADVLLITVDALRADHVGAYGYPRPTTPNIDALARRGVRFERAYAQAPHTSFSTTTMLTGRYYPTLARLQADSDAAIAEDVLPFHLRRYGWKTAAFYPPAVFYVEADKLSAFERTHFQFEYCKVEYMDAHARISQIAEFFELEHPGRVFMWIHFFEPHEPYDRWEGHDFGKRDIDRYDSEIAYTDAAVGRLLAYFQKNRPNTIVVLTADHGEAFDEHKARYHGSSLYDEQIRVPLIVAVPGVTPHVVPGPVEMVDIAPTILGLLDIPVPVRMRGTDLGPWLRHPPAPADRLGYAFAEFEDTRMVASRQDKLISETRKGFLEYYDLASDPGERHSLVEQRPDRVNVLSAALESWFSEQTRFALPPRKNGGPIALERAQLGDPAAVDEVAGLLSDRAPAVRTEAARLLATTLPARPRTRPSLRAALDDAEPEVRGWSAVALARLGDADARARVRQLVGGGESALRLPAAMVLADAGDPAAVAPLGAELGRCKEAAVCRPIVQALGRLRDRAATAGLLAHLDSVMDRRDTVTSLGEIADPAAVPALATRLADDEYVTVRAAAAEALGKMGPAAGEGARAALRAALAKEREPFVLAAVRAALDRLGAGPPERAVGRARGGR